MVLQRVARAVLRLFGTLGTVGDAVGTRRARRQASALAMSSVGGVRDLLAVKGATDLTVSARSGRGTACSCPNRLGLVGTHTVPRTGTGEDLLGLGRLQKRVVHARSADVLVKDVWCNLNHAESIHFALETSRIAGEVTIKYHDGGVGAGVGVCRTAQLMKQLRVAPKCHLLNLLVAIPVLRVELIPGITRTTEQAARRESQREMRLVWFVRAMQIQAVDSHIFGARLEKGFVREVVAKGIAIADPSVV